MAALDQTTDQQSQPFLAKEPLAIIGIGCRFPGGANDPASYWKMLCNGVDAVTDIPPDRWNIDSFFHPEADRLGKTNSRWGGFIGGIDAFDADFFGISPREASQMDPQQRLLLEVAFEALEDGGQTLDVWCGKDVAVFMGLSSFDYSTMQTDFRDRGHIDVYTNTGTALSIAANRISYCFDFQGPSATVDTACSSSLAAVHLACQSLWRRESSLALAGGVNILINPDGYIGFSKLSMMSPDGRCRAFDARANGFVRGEGAGVVILKPLSRARADEDRIYALIRSTAVNQDGRSAGMTAPSQAAQEALLRKACQEAGVEPAQIQYVEAHGTGTAVGDPIEARALGAVLATGRRADRPCLIGSVKSNIGHLEPASGIAGLIKTALALRHRRVPPSLHFDVPNPEIPFAELKLRVPRKPEPWPEHDGPALAGVNSFGFGGTNAHVILQEAEASDCRLTTDSLGQSAVNNLTSEICYLIPVSARCPEALQQLASSFKDLIGGGGPSLPDLAFTAGRRRSHHPYRLAVVAHSAEELAQGLDSSLTPGCEPTAPEGDRKLAFVFCGQGPQWWGMGRQLLAQEPVFRKMVERCDLLLDETLGWSVLHELMAEESCSRLDETAIAQPAIFTVQVALAELWRSWGIEPNAVVGHSVGEVAAAYVAGVLSLEDAIQVIGHRGRCMELAPAKGGMLAVGMRPEEVASVLNGCNEAVAVAAVNGPASLTLSGPTAALQEIARMLDGHDVFHRFLRVNYAFHSPGLEPVREELLRSLNSIEPRRASRAMFSTVTGGLIAGHELDAEYWWRNLRQPVRFLDSVSRLLETHHGVIIEIGPHPVLTSAVMECSKKCGQEAKVVPSLRRQEDEGATMRRSLGVLYTLGHRVNWSEVNRGGRFVSLPAYPWQRQRYWHESEELRQRRIGRPDHPLLGQPLGSPEPTWETRLDLHRFPWLNDHRVRGRIVFPGVAYLELALAAASALQPESIHVLEDVKFLEACIFPDNQAIVLETIVQDEGTVFAIHGRREDAPGRWTQYARGVLRSRSKSLVPAPVKLAEVWDRCPVEVPREECYQLFREHGLDYGPAFQGIDQMWRGDRECVARIDVRETVRGLPSTAPLHPATADACLHVVLGALFGHGTKAGVYLPVEIAEVRAHRWSGETLWSHGRLVEKGRGYVVADVRVFEESGPVVWEALGLRCQSIGAASEESGDPAADLLYESKWELQPLSPDVDCQREGGDLPSPELLAESVLHASRQWLAEQDLPRRNARFLAEGGRLSVLYAWEALNALGADFQPDWCFTLESLAERLQVIPRHHCLLNRFLDWLVEEGVLAEDHEQWRFIGSPQDAKAQTAWRELLHRQPSFTAELLMMERCGRNLAGVLRGEVDPLQLIFPEASLSSAEHLYQDSDVWRFYSLVTRDALRRIVERLPEGRTLRILEVGAGTGAMASYLLPILPADRTEYVFTDLSSHFLNSAAEKFRDYPFVRYQRLDIEQDPVLQGYTEQSFDIVIASQVLHATAKLRDSLAHIRRLLASSGWLLVQEFVRPARWLELVFGTLEGWWRFADRDLRPAHPILDISNWRTQLEQSGFREIVDLSGSYESMDNALLAARGPIVQRPTAMSQPNAASSASRGCWLLFADKGGVAEMLANGLKSRGEHCVLIRPGQCYRRCGEDHFELADGDRDDVELLLAELKADALLPATIVHLWGLDGPAPEDLTAEVLEESQRLACLSVVGQVQGCMSRVDDAPRLVLVTRRAQAVKSGEHVAPDQAMLWGLGRVIMNEAPRFRCRRVDLGCDDIDAEVQGLLDELCAETAEDEVAFRGRGRYVHRYVRCVPERMAPPAPRSEEAQPFRLQVSPSATLADLTLRKASRRPPGPGEVEIEVVAAGLNFSDVMKALGLYPGLADGPVPLGLECSGKISAIGEDVADFRIGDEVLALAEFSFSKYVLAPTHFVAQKPEHLRFEEAATIPVAFLTAFHALHQQGRMEVGERVLIHSAAGGVGLAAVQLARAARAEVFATAGTPEKRDFLRSLGVEHVMDSRSMDFADEVMERTRGRGVDLVLNSLSGEAIAKGLSVLADHGRFLEIGKSDIYKNSKLGMYPFRKNVSLIAIDLVGALRDKAGQVAAEFHHVIERIREGKLSALPYRAFPLDRVRDAFRFVSQGKHIGKVVLSFRGGQPSLARASEPAPLVHANASYLIAGGLGGFGLAVASWLVEQGARHLVLMGRGGATNPDAQQAVAGLKEAGAQVLVVQGDVSLPGDVARAVAETESSMPPLRGVIHAAMVLDDCLLDNLTPECWLRVMRPKVIGAWNLHSLTRGLPLDFFVCFSSMAAVFGTPGQANYSAANAFLDSFAYYRRARGLPALSIDWGYVGEVGYVARNQKVGDRFESWGARRISPRHGLALLGRLLQNQAVHAGIMGIDWNRLRFGSSSDNMGARFQDLFTAARGHNEEIVQDGVPLRAQLLDLDPADRGRRLESALRDKVARALGAVPSRLDVHKSIAGIDSLVGVELRNWIEEELRVSIPIARLTQGPSVAQLAEMILQQLPGGTPKAPAPETPALGAQA